MRKLISLGLGFLVGAGFALVVVALFAPSSGKALRDTIKQGYLDTMDEARRASADRQRELEAELEKRLGKPLLPGKPANVKVN